MKNNIIKEKSFQFAIRIVKLCNYLKTNNEFILSKQILKSWTSIGANIEEALWWQSKKDFYAKISIAYKEARETKYWILLLFESWHITSVLQKSFLRDIEEILRIITCIQLSLKKIIICNS